MRYGVKGRPHRLIGEDFANDLAARKDLTVGIAGQVDVKACIAVDDVVAAAACDEVAAAAAQHDVAVGERHRGSGMGAGKVAIKAGDQADIVEFVEGIDFGVVGAPQEVIEPRAADPLGLDEEVADGIAAGGQRIVDELAAIHVDADALCFMLVGRPVEAETALELVEAAQAQHDVIAAEALHNVAARTAVEDVVAGVQRNLAGRGALVADQEVVAAAALDPVVAFVALQGVAVLAAEDEVVALAAQNCVDSGAAVDDIVAVAAEHGIVAGAAVDDVIAGITMNDVVAGNVRDDVVAVAAEHNVIAAAAVEDIVAGVAIDRVIGVARQQLVVARGAAHNDSVAVEVIVAEETDRSVIHNVDEELAGLRV